MQEPSETRECSFEQRVADHWPLSNWQDVSVMVAVSGGPDSVALLLALHAIRQEAAEAKGRFEVAHFNHQWRADASDQDEQFVVSLCKRLSIPLHIERATDSSSNSRNEESARNERYAFLQRIAEQRGARYLVTAHNADDQAETIMHRILRGTGLRGLRGIQASRKLSDAVTVVRPLLWARRSEVIDFLQNENQDFRIDESNVHQKYTRNRIRADLLPKLSEHYNPAVVESLLRLGALADEAVDELSSLVEERAADCLVSNDSNHLLTDAIVLNAAKLGGESDFLQREILAHLWRERGWPEQAMSFKHWARIIVAIRQGDQVSLPGEVTLRVQGETVVLNRQPSARR